MPLNQKTIERIEKEAEVISKNAIYWDYAWVNEGSKEFLYKFIKQKYIEAATSEAERSLKLIEALEVIVNPIKYLQDEANKEGAQLNGMMAVASASNAEFLKSIARKALEKYEQSI